MGRRRIYIYIPQDSTPEGFSNFASAITIINLQRNCLPKKSSAILIDIDPGYEDGFDKEGGTVADSKIYVTIHATAYISNRKQENLIFKLTSVQPVNFVNSNNEIIDLNTMTTVTSNEKYYFDSEKGINKNTVLENNKWFVYKNKFEAPINYTQWNTTLDIISGTNYIFRTAPLETKWNAQIYIYEYSRAESKLFLYPLNFNLQNDVNLRHKFFLNLYFRLRKTIIKNLETKV